MANDKKAIRLLILDDSQNNAERLVSLLRNAGHATRAHRITSTEDLQECLQQNWDLCLAQPKTSFMSAEDAAALIKRQSRDVPLILLKPGIDIDMRTKTLVSRYPSAKIFVEWVMGGASKITRAALAQVAADERGDFIEAVVARLAPYRDGDSLALPMESTLLRAARG